MGFRGFKLPRRRLAGTLAVVTTCGLSCFTASAWAATDVVTNLHDSGPGSLRETVSAASPGDTVVFGSGLSGTISLTSGAIRSGNGLSIVGPGAGKLTIDGGHNKGVFTFGATDSNNVPSSLSGVTLADASGSGAIDFSVLQGTLTVANSTFTGDTAGGIEFVGHDQDLYVSNSVFTHNDGSAITYDTTDGLFSVSDSRFVDNHGSDGGALNYTSLGGPSTVSGSTFVGNSADNYGGAIADGFAEGFAGLLTVTNSTFTANSAGVSGSSGFGGAVAKGPTVGSSLTLVSDTIDGNSVTPAPGSAGSGVWTGEQFGDAGTSAQGTIVSGNSGAANCNVPVFASTFSLEGPLPSDTSCGFDLPSADPLLGPLADNGGPTPTQALLAGSPALYRIPQASCPTTTDQRGFPRPAAGQTACDVGAFERQTPPQIDAKASAREITAATATVTTPMANDLLVAFVATGSSRAAGNTARVSGGGLTWTLVRRENAARGDSEVWTARAAGALMSTSITAIAIAQRGYGVALTVTAFKNATGIGKTGSFTSPRGAPEGCITTSHENTWVFGVGNDPLRPFPRLAGPGQTIQHETFDLRGDTYWVQSTAGPTATGRSPIAINDIVPFRDPYNLVLVEVV